MRAKALPKDRIRYALRDSRYKSAQAQAAKRLGVVIDWEKSIHRVDTKYGRNRWWACMYQTTDDRTLVVSADNNGLSAALIEEDSFWEFAVTCVERDGVRTLEESHMLELCEFFGVTILHEPSPSVADEQDEDRPEIAIDDLDPSATAMAEIASNVHYAMLSGRYKSAQAQAAKRLGVVIDWKRSVWKAGAMYGQCHWSALPYLTLDGKILVVSSDDEGLSAALIEEEFAWISHCDDAGSAWLEEDDMRDLCHIACLLNGDGLRLERHLRRVMHDY